MARRPGMARTMEYGDTGTDVLELQQALAQLGDAEIGNPDGEFYGKTKAAVIRFQERHGIDHTGQYDHATHDALLADVTAAGYQAWYPTLFGDQAASVGAPADHHGATYGITAVRLGDGNSGFEVDAVGYAEPAAVGGLLWPRGAPAHVVISPLTIVTEPYPAGTFRLTGVTLADIEQMESWLGDWFKQVGIGEQPLPPSSTEPPQPTPAPAQQPFTPPPAAPPAPPLDGFERWRSYIEAGNKSMTHDVALSVLAGLSSLQVGQDFAFWLGPVAGGYADIHAGRNPEVDAVFPITPVKPDWWDTRPVDLGSPAAHARNPMIDRAKVMLYDYYVTIEFYDKHIIGQDGAYLSLIRELKKDVLDAGAIKAHADTFKHFLFMADATGDDATTVLGLSDD